MSFTTDEVIRIAFMNLSKKQALALVVDVFGVLQSHMKSGDNVHDIYERIIDSRNRLGRRYTLPRSHEENVKTLLVDMEFVSDMSFSEWHSIWHARFGHQVELPKPTWYDITSNLVSEVWTSASQLYGNLVGGGVVEVQSTDEHGVIVEDDFELVVVA